MMKSQAMIRGRMEREEEKSVVVGQIRRCLSVAVVRANATCLLDRLHQVGRGVAKTNGRREAAQWQEEMMRKERESEWAVRVGRNTLSRGLFLRGWRKVTYFSIISFNHLP